MIVIKNGKLIVNGSILDETVYLRDGRIFAVTKGAAGL